MTLLALAGMTVIAALKWNRNGPEATLRQPRLLARLLAAAVGGVTLG